MDYKFWFISTTIAFVALSPTLGEGATTPASSNNLCQNVTCAANEICKLVQVQCVRAPCDPQPQCVSARTCPQESCGLVCLYGKEKDADGCDMCLCYEPCYGVTCPNGQQCQPTKNLATNTYFGSCVATVTRAPCAPISCSLTCRFGRKSDSNGCEMCQCYDPCEDFSCPNNQRCVLTADDCTEGSECRDAPMRQCVGKESSGGVALSPFTYFSTTHALLNKVTNMLLALGLVHIMQWLRK